MTYQGSRKPGWQRERCTGKQSAPLDVRSGYSDSQSSVAAPKQHGNADDADAAVAYAAAAPTIHTPSSQSSAHQVRKHAHHSIARISTSQSAGSAVSLPKLSFDCM